MCHTFRLSAMKFSELALPTNINYTATDLFVFYFCLLFTYNKKYVFRKWFIARAVLI